MFDIGPRNGIISWMDIKETSYIEDLWSQADLKSCAKFEEQKE